MKTTYGTFNQNGGGITTLSQSKIKDFRVKMKAGRLHKWVIETGELLKLGLQAIDDKFPINEKDFDNDGKYIGKDKPKYLENMKKKADETKLFNSEEIEVPEITFTETELKSVDITSSVFTALAMLGLFIFPEDEENKKRK